MDFQGKLEHAIDHRDHNQTTLEHNDYTILNRDSFRRLATTESLSDHIEPHGAAVMLARRVLPRLQPAPSIRFTLLARRAYSSTELSNGITLAYDLHEPPSKPKAGLSSLRNAGPPIMMLHGLFGSRRNSRSVSKYAS